MTIVLDLGILNSKTIQLLFGCIIMELKEEGARRGHRCRPWRRWAAAPLTPQPCCSVVHLEAKSTTTVPHRGEQSRARWRRPGGAWRSAMAGQRQRSGARCGGGGERSRAAVEGPARWLRGAEEQQRRERCECHRTVQIIPI